VGGLGENRRRANQMLLIDDERIMQSINIRTDKAKFENHGQIRELLPDVRSGVVTPCNGHSLCPTFSSSPDTDDEMKGEDFSRASFIVGLDPPTNYFGASRYSLRMPRSIICHIVTMRIHLSPQHEKDTRRSSRAPRLIESREDICSRIRASGWYAATVNESVLDARHQHPDSTDVQRQFCARTPCKLVSYPGKLPRERALPPARR